MPSKNIKNTASSKQGTRLTTKAPYLNPFQKSLATAKNSSQTATAAQRTTRVSTQLAVDDDTSIEPWIEIITIQEFNRMHPKIYDIVEELIPHHPNHPFTSRWKALKAPNNKYVLTRTMGWRTAMFCFGIEDILQYREFVLRCPELSDKSDFIRIVKTREH
jgi:hypothetical protein